MAQIIFTDPEYIKRYTPLNISVDEMNITPMALTAQVKHIKAYLGQELYNKLIALIANGDISLPGFAEYKTLLDDYVRMAHAWWSLVEMMPILRVKISNGGLLQRIPSETSPATQQDVDALMAIVRQNAHQYTWELIEYLKTNRALYPEYKCAEKRVMSVAGFEIGGRRGYSWNQ